MPAQASTGELQESPVIDMHAAANGCRKGLRVGVHKFKSGHYGARVGQKWLGVHATEELAYAARRTYQEEQDMEVDPPYENEARTTRSSAIPGISLDTRTGRWKAKIAGRCIGLFDSEEEARASQEAQGVQGVQGGACP